MEAQDEFFKHENDGIELKEDMCALVTGDLTQSFSQPKLGRNTTENDVLETKYVLELEAVTLQEFIAHNNGDELNVDMDTKVSTSGRGTLCTLSQIAETCKDSLDASIKKVTLVTEKETYKYVGDLTKMIKHVANDESADAAIIKKMREG